MFSSENISLDRAAGEFSLPRKPSALLIHEELRADQIFPAVAYEPEEKCFVLSDSTLGVAFECSPLPGYQDKTQDSLQQFMNGDYPVNTSISFFLYRSPDCEERLSDIAAVRKNAPESLAKAAVDERIAFLREHTRQHIAGRTFTGIDYDIGLVVDTRLVVSVKIPFAGELPSQTDVTQAKQWFGKIESSLRTCGLWPNRMTADRYIRFMQTVLNWDGDALWRTHLNGLYEADKPVCTQILEPGNNLALKLRAAVTLGDDVEQVKVLSAKKLPPVMYFGEAMRLVGNLRGSNDGIATNYAICLNVIFPDREKQRGQLDRRRNWAVAQSLGRLVDYVPLMREVRDTFDIIYDEMSRNGRRALIASYHVLVFSDSQKDALQSSTAMQAFFATQGFRVMEDANVALPILRNALPFGCDIGAIKELVRYKTLTSGTVVPLLPVFSEWKGTGTPYVSLVARSGQLMSLSLHDTSTNKNAVIAAESGSGKSFLLNDLILSYLSDGAKVWVIDAGKSYKNLCELLHGDFVQFGNDSTICLNPYQLIDSWEEDEDGIVSLTRAMASEKGTLSEFQVAKLKEIMKACWDRFGKDMTVDTVCQLCIEQGREADDRRISDIGDQLFPFTSKGAYGRFIVGSNNSDFKSDFTVLELDELMGRKHLRQVVLLELVNQIQREMFLGERDRKKILVIDEAWDLLKEGEISVFMEHAYRKFRKYGGSAVIATQSVNDLYDSTVGRAIAENSATMLLLGQKAETIAAIREKKYLILSDGGFEMLESVHTEAGAYSEVFLVTERGKGIGRLVVSDFQKLINSANPEDFNAISHYRKQGMEIGDAVRAVLRDRQGARR